MPKLTTLQCLDHGRAWHIGFEHRTEDNGNIYYAFCQAIPFTERSILPSAVGGGWRVVASASNARRLGSLFPDFATRLAALEQQGERCSTRKDGHDGAS